MYTQDLIRRTFRLVNTAGGTGETPSDDEVQDALSWLNSMIDAWALEGLMMYRLLRTTHALTASTASYSIGSGGTINIVRPVEIQKAGLILDDTVSVPLEERIAVLTDEEYARWPDKTQTSTYPRGVWYDHNWSAGLGLLYPLPIPDQNNSQLVIYTQVAIVEFADLATTDYTFPPGYEECLETNLATILVTPFGRQMPEQEWQRLQRRAIRSMALIMRNNIRLTEIERDQTIPLDRPATLSQSRFDGGLV